ncbi:hypothetical protein D9M68_956760 [compost metagenome]
MPGEVDDEAFHHAIGNTASLIKLPGVKEVAGMLPVQCCHQLAGIEFVRCEERYIKFDPKLSGSAGREHASLWRQ